MDFWQVVDERHSVRAFEPGVDVSQEAVEKILQAAIRAPSGGNRQPWHFYVVRDAVVKSRLEAAAFGQKFVGQAPIVVVVCTVATKSSERYGDRGRELYCLQDTAAAVEHILLAAVALELGSCWVGSFDEGAASEALGLPTLHRPVALGKPARPAGQKSPRDGFDQVVTFVG
jgi:nitroreductase